MSDQERTAQPIPAGTEDHRKGESRGAAEMTISDDTVTKALMIACLGHPVGGGDGETCMVQVPTLATMRAALEAVMLADVSLGDLRLANIERQALWCPGQTPDLMFRACELGGEVGEALNVAKKIERERLGWAGSRATIEDLASELADVVICADLLALTEGIDLSAAVVSKFNATSDKVGLPTRLRLDRAEAKGGRR